MHRQEFIEFIYDLHPAAFLGWIFPEKLPYIPEHRPEDVEHVADQATGQAQN
ncbi:hypothetical protein [Dyadobacter aurulentus]|uniref:hypothetical protein n=1 Tax=Dyadobacter sp. UC 10 TaxID=2605428 RepID=UPI001788AC8F|nr:hypothetical protein [Dyadobacter sp. UC 10]